MPGGMTHKAFSGKCWIGGIQLQPPYTFILLFFSRPACPQLIPTNSQATLFISHSVTVEVMKRGCGHADAKPQVIVVNDHGGGGGGRAEGDLEAAVKVRFLANKIQPLSIHTRPKAHRKLWRCSDKKKKSKKCKQVLFFQLHEVIHQHHLSQNRTF